MATIQAFRGIRYAARAANHDISTRIAPPYDVLDQAGKDALVAGDPRNFVAIDLPHVPPKSAGPAGAYEAAANQMNGWLSDGTLLRDERTSLYVYHQLYTHGGTPYVRRKFFARLRLEEFGAGQVFPHEQTFGGPKEDRLALTKATRANLSPIFGLFEDPGNHVAHTIEQALPREPVAIGTLEGVESRMWGLTDGAAIGEVTRWMADKAVYIADGHHRYGTSLLYRKWLTEQRGPLPADHPANFILFVLCAMEDAGLLILPTHRVLPRMLVTADELRTDVRLEVLPLKAATAEDAVVRLVEFGPQAVALFEARSGTYAAIRPRDAGILREFEPAHGDAWRALGLSFLHAYLLDRLLTPRHFEGKAPEIHYVKSAGAAVEEARQSGGSVFLLQPTTMAELRGVCKAGDLMPQKSTYFFPKLASGMVINPLE